MAVVFTVLMVMAGIYALFKWPIPTLAVLVVLIVIGKSGENKNDGTAPTTAPPPAKPKAPSSPIKPQTQPTAAVRRCEGRDYEARLLRARTESFKIITMQGEAKAAADILSKASGNVYHVTMTSCECEDFKKGHTPCKHMIYFALHTGRYAQMERPIPRYGYSYACRKDKGSHKAAKRLQYWMCQVQRKPGPGWYCLKLDISKYFYRVNHEKLLAILGRRVKDPAMMAFIRGVVNSRAEPFGLPRWRTPQDTPPEEWLYEVGMPIGNLTSQLFANIYLNELDQYCKHRLKIHYYIRYMDDVIILGQDKETLHRWKAAVETFLQEELALDLNSKTSIRPVRQGVEFVGVRIWPTHMKLRKSTVRRIKREVRKISALYAAGDMTRQDFYRRIASIRGLLKHTESASLRWRLNEIYRAELEKAKQKQLREEAQYEPFADHSGAGNGDGNAGTGYQDHGNPACRAG